MKVILIFLAFCINLYGNLVTTNGKIGLYFDEEEMRIHSIRGDVFKRADISFMDIGALIDNKPYILREYMQSARIISNTNMIMINSEVEDVKFTTFILPSSLDRDKLYVNTVVKKTNEETAVKLLYRVFPYNNINILDYNSPKDYYSLDEFRVKSLNNPMGMYLSDEEFKESFKFREVRDRVIRYEDDKLLLASDIQGSGRISSDTLVFNFGRGEWENRLELRPQILKNEYNYWKDWNWEFQGYPKEVREQLTQLRMVTMGIPIPSTLSHTLSREQLVINMKLSTILATYGKSEEALEILKNYRFSRKNTAEDVVVLASLVKSWEASKDIVAERYIRTTIYPIVQRILDGIDEDGKFLIEEDSLENYYYLSIILEEILENRSDAGYLPVEKVETKLALLKKHISENYMTPEGFRDNPDSPEVNPRNITYINLYSKSVRKAILRDEYEKYYNKKLGFLMFPGDEYVDIKYNLTFAMHLYNNSFEKEGEQIFARIKELVDKNNNYITPRMYPFERNEAGIYGDLIFSYLLTNYFRGIE